jgi:succinoglycan biosynthesis protein ExoA
MVNNQTTVSVVIPARNEEKWIHGCLASILANDYPVSHLEILVVDGSSEDRTREIVGDYVQQYSFIRLLENPRRIIPAALNIGIREARGEIIVRMDAHTTYATDYIRRAVQALETSGAAMVGAIQRPAGNTLMTRAIASATSSPFGVGNSYYHYGNESRWVEDSVYLGAWHKKTLTKLSEFNEKWLINEDSELNQRLREAGGKILLCADLHCSYHVRSTLRALARQYFRYGMWRAKTSIIHPASLGWRQVVPPAFVASSLLSLMLIRISLPLALLVPVAYALTNLLTSGTIVARQGWGCFLVPIAFCTIHVSWGAGFVLGLARFCLMRRKGTNKPTRAAADAKEESTRSSFGSQTSPL